MNNKVTISPRLIKPRDAAAYLACSERTLFSLTKNGIIPAVRFDGSRMVRYDKADLDSFIQAAKTGGRL